MGSRIRAQPRPSIFLSALWARSSARPSRGRRHRDWARAVRGQSEGRCCAATVAIPPAATAAIMKATTKRADERIDMVVLRRILHRPPGSRVLPCRDVPFSVIRPVWALVFVIGLVPACSQDSHHTDDAFDGHNTNLSDDARLGDAATSGHAPYVMPANPIDIATNAFGLVPCRLSRRRPRAGRPSGLGHRVAIWRCGSRRRRGTRL